MHPNDTTLCGPKWYLGYEVRGKTPTPGRRRVAKSADYTGRVFDRLTVEKDLGLSRHGNRAWGCVCICGARLIVNSKCLRLGKVRSCGCINSEICGGRNKLPYGHASRNELLASYKKSAASRGHVWALTDSQFFALVSSDCHYCGMPPDSVRKPNKACNGEFLYSGVDRVDNALGYLTGNVVSCCWTCNRAKGKLSAQQFDAWRIRVAAHVYAKGAV